MHPAGAGFPEEYAMAVRTALAGLVALLIAPSTALAADSGSNVAPAEPYAIEKVCSDGKYGCTVRMIYPTGTSAMVVHPGSYWYEKPSRQGVVTVRN
jgi:hypothetical protein